MAKWGEGDPRWVVDEKGKEGVNVNGWHWTEVNRLQWCKERLAELLIGLETEGSELGRARTTEVKSVTGEVCEPLLSLSTTT